MDERQQTREDTILDAAHRLILQFGYDKMTMGDIAHEAGVSKGTIYQYYSSKESLVDSLVLRQMQRLGEDTMLRLEQDESTWSFTGMYANSLKSLTDYPLVMAVSAGNEQIIGRYLHRTSLDFLAMKRGARPDILHMMQESGVIRQDFDIDVLSYILDFMSYGFMKIREAVPPDEAPPLDAVLTMLGRILDEALLPPDGGDEEAGKRIILGMIKDFRQRMEQMQQDIDQ